MDKKQIESENNGLPKNAKEDVVNIDSIKERINKIEKELDTIDKKAEKLHSDMEKYAGPEEEDGSFNHVRKTQKENAAFGKAEQKPEIVEKAIKELKDSYSIKKEELERRVEKIKSDIENVAKDRDDVKNVKKSDLSKVDSDIERIGEDIVLFKESLADLHVQAQESIEQFEKIYGAADDVAMAKSLGAAAANTPGNGDAREELSAVNRKIKEAQKNKNAKMENHYKEQKVRIVEEIKRKEQEDKENRRAAKKKGNVKPKPSLAGNALQQGAEKGEADKKKLVDLLDLIYKQKQEIIASGKVDFKQDFSRSFGKLSFPSFAKKNKVKFDKLSQGQGDEIRDLVGQHNKDLEKAFNEKKVKFFGNKQVIQEDSVFIPEEDNETPDSESVNEERIGDRIENNSLGDIDVENHVPDYDEEISESESINEERIGLPAEENISQEFPEHDDETLESESVNEERVGSEVDTSQDTGREIELQVLKGKKEELEKELEEVEKANSDGVRLMRLQQELVGIEKQMGVLEKGEVQGEISAADTEQFQKEIEQMPVKERERLGFGLRNMGFFARELKSKKLAELCEFASKKSKGNKFLAALAETYRKDEGGARKQIEDSNKKVKGVQQLQNVGYITGGALKWGRNVADVVGWTAGSPLRWVTLGAQFFSRGAEAAKEARFKNEKVINKTRIKDVDKAADQAWVLYEQARLQVGKDGIVSGESLNKSYSENLPQDLLDRLKNPEPGVATGFVQSLLKKDLEWAIKNGKITKNSFELFLKDCDRLIGEYGEVDTVALGAKYAQTAGKAVIAGVAVESIALLIQKAIHETPDILSRLGDIWDGKELELPKSPYSSEMEIPQPERAPDALGIKEGAGQMQEFGYQGGKSIWQEAGKQLEARFNLQADDESMEVLKTLNVDKIKDAIVENPAKYGLVGIDNFDNLSTDKLQGIDWNRVFDDLKAQNTFVSKLDSANGGSILRNNETLRTFFAEHPDAPRTSENYENILQGEGDTGEEPVKEMEGTKELNGQIEFENQYGLKIKVIDDKMEISDANGKTLDIIPVEEGIGAEENIKNAKIEALHIINWSKADFENVVGKSEFDIIDGKQPVFKGIAPGSARISIEDAERAGINVFGKVGLSSADKVKLNVWMENLKVLNSPEKAKLFFDLSEQTGIKLSSSEFKSAFSKLPEVFSMEQKIGYMNIFAGGDVKGGVNDLLGMEDAHAKEVIVRDDVLEVKDLVYKGKRMDVFISKDGKIGIDGDGIRLGVEKKWLGLGKTMPMMDVDEKNIGLIQNRIGVRKELILDNIQSEKVIEPEAVQDQAGLKSSGNAFNEAAKGRLDAESTQKVDFIENNTGKEAKIEISKDAERILKERNIYFKDGKMYLGGPNKNLDFFKEGVKDEGVTDNIKISKTANDGLEILVTDKDGTIDSIILNADNEIIKADGVESLDSSKARQILDPLNEDRKINLEEVIASQKPLMYEFKDAKISFLNFKFDSDGEIKSVMPGHKPDTLLNTDAVKTEKWSETYSGSSPVNKGRFSRMATRLAELHEGYKNLLADGENELAEKLLRHMQKEVRISKGVLKIPE